MNYSISDGYDIRIETAWGALNIGSLNANLMDEVIIDYYEWRIVE